MNIEGKEGFVVVFTFLPSTRRVPCSGKVGRFDRSEPVTERIISLGVINIARKRPKARRDHAIRVQLVNDGTARGEEERDASLRQPLQIRRLLQQPREGSVRAVKRRRTRHHPWHGQGLAEARRDVPFGLFDRFRCAPRDREANFPEAVLDVGSQQRAPEDLPLRASRGKARRVARELRASLIGSRSDRTRSRLSRPRRVKYKKLHAYKVRSRAGARSRIGYVDFNDFIRVVSRYLGNVSGKIVNFAGWLLPVQYRDAIAVSHQHTRSYASLFDVGHMLQTRVFGKDAGEFLESLTTCDLRNLKNNAATLTVFTNDQGGILDDLIVTKDDEDKYFVVSNAGRRDEDGRLLLERQVIIEVFRMREVQL